MKSLLTLAIYILAAAGLAWLTWWGANAAGFPDVPSMIVAGIVFVLVLILGLNKSGVGDI